MAQWLMCLLCKHEDLSSISRTPGKKPGKAACGCYPHTGNVETGVCLRLAAQPAYPRGEFQALSNKTKENGKTTNKQNAKVADT